jgi:hypothetical protein
VDLVPRKFSLGPFAGNYYGSAGCVDLNGVLKGDVGRQQKQLL